ncbi:hypothetical protein T440DRAFT_473854 [Plenodomus tracheiphilus IPT5]|uniref:Uncharacterized protein n=1 Tax=Plenodomus tracheiphilus IPT5 TaxID=1408161 RepID=A0A6A7ANL5_9PLEO|nr:hypothetical protein T440DRAFT_473854 [Plenodomus tracheiphilus IPT5]
MTQPNTSTSNAASTSPERNGTTTSQSTSSTNHPAVAQQSTAASTRSLQLTSSSEGQDINSRPLLQYSEPQNGSKDRSQ